MPACVIADTQITDHKTYDDYKRQVAPQIAKIGGRFLVRGGNHVVLEGSWRPHRLVVIEFPTMEAITAWYNSAEYAPLLALRQPAATDHLVAVEGTEGSAVERERSTDAQPPDAADPLRRASPACAGR